MAANDTSQGLDGIEHIVVLMKENRSFDQMLGYLEDEGLEVEGLDKARATAQEHPNRDQCGQEYPPFAWEAGQTLPPVPPGRQPKILDPCHGPGCIAEQLEDGNSGFVRNFEKTRHVKGPDGKPVEVQLEPEYLRVPMGHFTKEHLPVYDYLAKNFCVCDHWHSSIPGDTWPNRLFAYAGLEVERVGYKRNFFGSLLAKLKGLPGVDGLRNAPIYDVAAFPRQLEPGQWRWYSHDPSTLRAADQEYRKLGGLLNRGNFAYLDRTKLELKDEWEAALHTHDSFLDDAAKGELREVSWIDPNFADLSVLHTTSSDDHPPADIKAGQDLVLQIYDALVNSPNWDQTLLIIFYDEHGGFYDHVPAPQSPFKPDNSRYQTLGVRVPALLAGPRVKRVVCHDLFEHTSVMATILRRFAPDPQRALAAMPPRVRQAPDLGTVVGPPREDLPDHSDLLGQMDAWRLGARRARRAGGDQQTPTGDGAGQEVDLHDFQDEFLRYVLAIRDQGLPPGQP
jgi:phospholipase C